MLAENTTAALDALYGEMGALQLQGLWTLGDEIQATRPKVKTAPYVWHGADIRRVLLGEVAPTHRHTPAAVRFMLRGHGAYTTVAGERCNMSPGDLVLTPRMS